MKRFLLAAMVCLGAWCLAGCAQDPAESGEIQETTAAAVTTTAAETTVTTTKATTTVTTTTQAQYLLAEDIALKINPASVRSSGCTFTVANSGETNQPYSKCWRILDPETEKELKVLPDAQEMTVRAEGVVAPEQESPEIKAEWETRYGELADGTYLLELVLEEVAEEQGGESSDTEKEPRMIPKLARAELVIDSQNFVPRVSIDPATVTPEGCVMTVRNSPDVGRSYSLVFRIYAEGTTRTLLLKGTDVEAQRADNYHMEPGESLTLKYNWRDKLGSLAEGDYSVEIDLLPDDGTPAVSYIARFTIES